MFNRNCQIFNYRRSSVPADRQPTVGIGLASRLFHTDFCRHKSPSATGAILADSIRSRWSTSDCEVDVFLLCSVSLHCPNRSSIDHTAPLRHLVRRRPTDPLLFLSLNDRLRRGIGPADWLAVEKLSSRPAAHCADRISGALRLLQKLLPMAAKVEPSRINPDRSPRGHQRYGELLPPHRQHTIPGWAILVFAGCALLTCLCFLLGHLINRASSLKKRRSLASEAASVALHKKHDRRWGAGFGGGLIEIQNKSQTGAGGQVGGRGASKKQASLFKGFTQASHKHTGSNRAANPWSRI